MEADERPIAWTALKKGTPIHAADGEPLGKVSSVVADEQKDIFSGLTFRSGLFDAERFVPAELIRELTDGAVHLTISSRQAEGLEPFET